MTQQQTLGQDTVSRGLLQALLDDEKALEEAHREYTKARANLDVTSRRYAAMRDDPLCECLRMGDF